MDRREFLKATGGLVGLFLTGSLPREPAPTQRIQKPKPIEPTPTDAKKREFYLKGMIDYGKGWIGGERILAYKQKDGSEAWGIFDARLIKDGMLKVKIIGEENGLVYVVVPQILENNSDILCVKREEIYVA